MSHDQERYRYSATLSIACIVSRFALMKLLNKPASDEGIGRVSMRAVDYPAEFDFPIESHQSFDFHFLFSDLKRSIIGEDAQIEYHSRRYNRDETGKDEFTGDGAVILSNKPETEPQLVYSKKDASIGDLQEVRYTGGNIYTPLRTEGLIMGFVSLPIYEQK